MVNFSFNESGEKSLTFNIETDRLIGREIRESDSDFVFQVQGDPEMMKFVGNGEGRSKERTDRYCNSLVKLWREGNPVSAYMFFTKNVDGEEGDFVGMVTLEEVYDSKEGDRKTKSGVVERTTYINKAHQGKGYASEIYDNLFEAIIEDRSREKSFFVVGGKNIKEIYATAHPGNIASIRMQEKGGFEMIGEGEKIINGEIYPRKFFSLNLDRDFSRRGAESKENNEQPVEEAFFTVKSLLPGEADIKIPLPAKITLEDGKELKFSRPKTSGRIVGGFYRNGDEEFMVKMGPDPYFVAENNEDKFQNLNCLIRYESLLNNLAKVALKDSAAPQTTIGKYKNGECEFPCFVSPVIPGYRDIENKSFSDEEKKTHRIKFHPAFVFNALVANDDISDENLGVDGGGNPINVDYGVRPVFLFEERRKSRGKAHEIASFIGHQGTVGKQLVRRKYFGYDEATNPLELGRNQEVKENDISYLEVISSVKYIVDHKAELLSQTQSSITKIEEDTSIPESVKLKLCEDFQTIASTIEERINYLEKKFSRDFPNISEKAEEFQNLKWRNHTKFRVIFEESRISNKEIVAKSNEQNIRSLLELIESSTTSNVSTEESFQTIRERVLGTNFSELTEEKKESIKKFAEDKFLLHTSVISQDLDMTKWLLNNEISDINSSYRQRNHSYQYVMTTPLSTAISIHDDAMIYDHKYHSSDEMIKFLAEKFFEKNPQARESGYSSDHGIPFPLRFSKLAFERFEGARDKLKNQAETMIQAWVGNAVRTSVKAKDVERLSEETDERVIR